VHIANGNPANVDLVRHSRFWQFRVPTVAACHSYLVSEVPDVFPRLRVGFIEAGAQWLVWVLEGAARTLGMGRQRVHEVLAARRVWVTCEYEDHLDYLLPHVGEDNLLIGTDYGHTDPFSNVRALQVFVERTDVSDTAKKKIVGANARAFYGITDAELPDYARQATPATAAARA
jgi:predicted TIM-barrel fold metal-dependent hydrolase